jgi:hypothetical protein
MERHVSPANGEATEAVSEAVPETGDATAAKANEARKISVKLFMCRSMSNSKKNGVYRKRCQVHLPHAQANHHLTR